MDDQNRNLILATALSFAVILVWFLLFPPPEPTEPGPAPSFPHAHGEPWRDAAGDERRRKHDDRHVQRHMGGKGGVGPGRKRSCPDGDEDGAAGGEATFAAHRQVSISKTGMAT